MSKALELCVIVLDGQLPMDDFRIAVQGLEDLTRQKIVQYPDQSRCSLIIVGTENTENPFGNDDNFRNISTFLPQDSFDMSLFRKLNLLPQPGNAPAGDFISGVSLGVHRIREFITNTKKVLRPSLTLLVGSARRLPGAFEDLRRISRDASIPLFDTTFVVFGGGNADMIEALRGFDSCKVINADDWSSDVKVFNPKPVGQVAKSKLNLSFGPGCDIPVNVYVKVKAHSMPTLKKRVKGQNCEVSLNRVYVQANDVNQQAVPQEYLTKAYKYGKVYVPITDYEKVHIQMQAEKCLIVLATINKNQVPPNRWMGPAEIVTSDPGSIEAAEKLSAIIHALYDADSAILARFVARPNSDPKLVALFPFISDTAEYLTLVPLPFADDSRESVLIFPPLPSPSEEQQDAMNALVDSLMLPTNTINVGVQPALQRLWRTLFHRLQHPEDATWIADIDDTMRAKVFPELILHARVQDELAEVHAMFPTVLREDPTSRRREVFMMNREAFLQDQPQAVQPDQVRAAVEHVIGTVNPVADFVTLLRQSDDRRRVHQVMGGVIQRILADGNSNTLVEKAFGSIIALRDDAEESGVIEVFNDLLLQLITEYPRQQGFWRLMNTANVTVIDPANEATVTATIEELTRGVEVAARDELIDDLE